MARFKVVLAYDGTNFAGFQRQPHQRTVEGVLTNVINKMAKHPNPAIIVYGSGRTDAGVHALGQVIHFDFPFKISEIGMLKGINSMLPLDMEVSQVIIVDDDFHARYDVSGKRYLYRFDLSEFINPFKRFYTGHWRFPVDINRIKQAIPSLVGEHDFSSFVASGSTAKTNVRTIYEATCYLDRKQNEVVLEFYGNGFLYNMVRIMAGVLIEIGSNRRDVNDIERLFKVKNRNQARLTAPASGLYLKRVYYEGDDPDHPTKLPVKQR
ncbi:tRNA pseudouridine(38-40) synthase TruA [Nicoliella spurrieriana]|uniref:tRNA pseudouridine synthase A n=1 Tax=Nicoliella spurrieriana TaxID=2925830 RepID=A0A976RRB0_9LACO|nr:tRNA pseudouridine(38-40) synthase TruA [Nicoliella spurrieriana]UQS86377.1 tRNA pseudouridine(38-40) synthase TruA [Nicoliella spurrieriana]